MARSSCAAILSVDIDVPGCAHTFANIAQLNGGSGLHVTTLYNNGEILVS